MKNAGYSLSEDYSLKITSLFLSLEGEELLNTKHLLDSTGSAFNLLKLISILPTENREHILLHFSKQFLDLQEKKATVLSDIDDTLYCSGGDGIGGLDKRFQR